MWHIISLVHSDHKEPISGYESNNLEDNYFIKTGEIKQWSDPYIDSIKNNIANGNTAFSIGVESGMPDNYKNVIYNLVAYQLTKDTWDNYHVSVSSANNKLDVKVSKKETADKDVDGKNSTVYQGVDYSAVYDYEYYIAHNEEVQETCGGDAGKALKYFVEKGIPEKQQANEEFNVETYMERYGDLREAFGDDIRQYYIHYIACGKAEGRSAIK